MKESFKNLIKNSLKWEEFYGKKNTDETLVEKSFALAKTFSYVLKGDVDYLQKIINELDFQVKNEKWWDVYYDFMLFMTHLSDREAFILLEAPQRTLFIESLLKKEIEILSAEIDKKQVEQFKKKFFRNFVLFQKEFSEYKQGKTTYLRQNLNYMFAERIAKRIGGEESAVLISNVFTVTVAAEIFLNIPQIIKEE